MLGFSFFPLMNWGGEEEICDKFEILRNTMCQRNCYFQYFIIFPLIMTIKKINIGL